MNGDVFPEVAGSAEKFGGVVAFGEGGENAFAEFGGGSEGELVVDELDDEELEVFVGEGFLGDGGEGIETLNFEKGRGFSRCFDALGEGGDGGGGIGGRGKGC